MDIFAVIELSGKQFKVKQGDVISVDAPLAQEGEKIVVDRVLALSDGKSLRAGDPYIQGASVVFKVLEVGKSRKISSFTYKRREKTTRRHRGHRQDITRLVAESIEGA